MAWLNAVRRSRLAGALVTAAALLGLALYGIVAPSGNVQARVCEGATATAERLRPLARGEVAAVQVPTVPRPLVDLAFVTPDGRPVLLSQLRGKTLLVNLWATWCAPCRKEMPALDQVQAQLGGQDFEVVAINIDTRDAEKPKAFLREIGVASLQHYTDPTAKVFQTLKAAGRAFGMPTTLLVDREGCELGHLAGPAEWASDDALALLRAALNRQ
jgi:thiol-disulfide isomerase/thioredoxin